MAGITNIKHEIARLTADLSGADYAGLMRELSQWAEDEACHAEYMAEMEFNNDNN